ncbi:MAG: helix-turn-helix domain-containing protein [Pseudonocardiales bacterium]
MSRLLLVTRNAALAMALASEPYELVVLRPDAADEWRAGLAVADAAILDVGDPVAVEAVLQGLQGDGLTLPVIVATDGEALWDRVRLLRLSGVTFLQLPLSKGALLTAVHDALGASTPAVAIGAPEADSIGTLLKGAREKQGWSLADVSRRTLILQATVGQIEDDDFSGCDDVEFARDLVRAIATALGLPLAPVVARFDASFAGAQRHSGRRPEPLTVAHPASASSPRQATPAEAPRPQQAPRKQAPAAKPVAALVSSAPAPRERPRRIFPTARAPRPAVPVAAPPLALDELLQRLLERSDQMAGVGETADVVLAESLDRSGGDAGCLILPDEQTWLVYASKGLSGAERRARLGEGHWLVRDVVLAGHAFMVTDSDIVRGRLADAPLAACRHIIGVPIARVAGLVLIGRDAPPFVKRDLEAVLGLCAEAARLLTTAVLVRRLARKLGEYRN